MLLLMISILAIIAVGYVSASLFDSAYVKSFSTRKPVVSALAAGAWASLLVGSLLIGYGQVVRDVSPSDMHMFVSAVAYLFGVVVPISVILRRLGYNGWWAMVAFIPVTLVVGVWFLALRTWPHQKTTINTHGATDDIPLSTSPAHEE